MNSNSFNIEYQTNKSDAISIIRHLSSCDSLFEPPLSSYVNIQEYGGKLSNRAINFEAWHKNRLIGLVSVYFNDPGNESAFISNVSVEADYQNQGIASRLLAMAMEYGTQSGFSSIKLEVQHDNIKALNLYKRLGFEKENLRNQKLVMLKYL